MTRLFLSVLMSLCAVNLAKASVANVPSLLTLCVNPAELVAIKGIFKFYSRKILESNSSEKQHEELLKEKYKKLRNFEKELNHWNQRLNLNDNQRFAYTGVLQRRIQQVTREIAVIEFIVQQMPFIVQDEESSSHVLSPEHSFHALPESLKNDLPAPLLKTLMILKEEIYTNSNASESIDDLHEQIEIKQPNKVWYLSKILAGATVMGVSIAGFLQYMNSKNQIVVQPEMLQPTPFDVSSFVSNNIAQELAQSVPVGLTANNGLVAQPVSIVQKIVYPYVAATAAAAVVSCLLYWYWYSPVEKESSDVINQDTETFQDDIELALRDKSKDQK